MMFQPCFLAVERKPRMVAKSAAPSGERKPPEIFMRSFIMRTSRSASLLLKGTAGSSRKRSVSLRRASKRSSRLCPVRRGAPVKHMDETAHCFGKALQARGAGAAHALDRRGGDPDAKQIGHERDDRGHEPRLR